MGLQDYTTNAYMNEKNAVALGILQQPGSNALQTVTAVKATMANLKKSFPPGLDYKIIYNPTEFVSASIDEVYKTLLIAIALVVVVVIVFLQSWRAALIPVIAIPVSLVGTFGLMAVAGFSLNNLSLFGLVLAIGIVVDDAIVVVENIERHLSEGMDPRDAAHKTMDEVGGALVAIALVLMAVFVPTAFISGISGQFYKQFALTIAGSTLISLVVSLTLSPALGALIMRPHHHQEGRPRRGFARLAALGDRFNKGFTSVEHRYSKITRRLVRMAALMLLIYLALLATTAWRLSATPKGFIPVQDQGNLLVAISLPPGADLNRTDAVVREVGRRMLAAPGAAAASMYAGVDATTGTTSPSSGQIYLIFTSFADRAKHHLTIAKIIADLKARVADITDADIKIIQPPSVRGIGSTGGFKMIVEDQGGHGPARPWRPRRRRWRTRRTSPA